jgi:hypothetical protein
LENKFKVGDKVQLGPNYRTDKRTDAIGHVVRIGEPYVHVEWDVRNNMGQMNGGYFPNNLTLVVTALSEQLKEAKKVVQDLEEQIRKEEELDLKKASGLFLVSSGYETLIVFLKSGMETVDMFYPGNIVRQGLRGATSSNFTVIKKLTTDELINGL